MIELTFSRPHRSILSLPPTHLEDLSVITGINGSGKSQLLEAMKSGAITVAGVQANDVNIRLFNWTNLVPNDTGQVDPINIIRNRGNFVKGISDSFLQARQKVLQQFSSWKPPNVPPLTAETVLAKLDEAIVGKVQTRAGFIEVNVDIFATQCTNSFGNNAHIKNLIANYASSKGVNVTSMTTEQIDSIVPLNWNPVDMFQQDFSQIFAAYYRAFDENSYNEFSNERHGESKVVLTKHQFIARFGEPPWEFVNRILKEAHLDYVITSPTGRGDAPFQAKLVSATNKTAIAFQDLSSGEKIIMSFALCFYNANDFTRSAEYPKLLLFDEIDAPLHPSMTKDLLRVIEQVLVKEKGIKVVMTTHSPATVAFSPKEGLYRLEKDPRTLEPCSQDRAIQALTSGYISITGDSRFVITEARWDKAIYTNLAAKLTGRGILSSSPNLVFIQASDTKDRAGGGKAQVKDWGTKLPEAGLFQIFGLIDRDTNNSSSATVKVLPRYSLENYLFDPVLLYAVLMKDNEHRKVIDIGITDANFYKLKDLDQPTLQRVVDAICALIEENGTVHKATLRFEIEYQNGRTVIVPEWLREFRGHDLEIVVRDVFKKAISNSYIITRNECSELIDMLVERLPEFTPSELIDTLKELQQA